MERVLKEHQQRMRENRIWRKYAVPVLVFAIVYFGGHVLYWWINK